MITVQLKEPEKITAHVKPVTMTAGGGIKQEVDPTVPAWAKQPEKPTYTAEEVGAIPAAKLPEAINAALAQAKESGEFDGEPGKPGTTPHIGANGNWYIGETDTGVKAQGKDYVLTDADKTEIAGMAAELVDAPEGGGGDTWRLVADVRLTEDTATIEITQDTAGNAFALKEYLLIGRVVGAADNASAGSLYVNALSKTNAKPRIGYASQSVPVKGGKKVISCYGKVCGKRLRTIFGADGDGQSNINAQMFTMGTTLDASFAAMEFDAIKNISLSTNVAGYGIGTRLELWGVDA